MIKSKFGLRTQAAQTLPMRENVKRLFEYSIPVVFNFFCLRTTGKFLLRLHFVRDVSNRELKCYC